jgi:8-oxo-dGTP pyrophosphatase MutT (NUDIX family)
MNQAPLQLSIANFLSEISQILKQDKPGLNAHSQMMPQGRIMVPEDEKQPRKSAVLLLFYLQNNRLYFPIIRRPVYNGIHSGQMALPGGKFEDRDKSLVETALRECHEEIGVLPNEVRVLGALSELYIHVTHMLVLPVVGFVEKKPTFKTDPLEVDALFEIEYQQLFDPELKKKEPWNLRGETIDVPFYYFAKQKVWGATAMILSEFEQMMQHFEFP